MLLSLRTSPVDANRVVRLTKDIYDAIDEQPLHIEAALGLNNTVVAVQCRGRAWRGVSLALTLLSRRNTITLDDLVDTLRSYHSLDECVSTLEIGEKRREEEWLNMIARL